MHSGKQLLAEGTEVPMNSNSSQEHDSDEHCIPENSFLIWLDQNIDQTSEFFYSAVIELSGAARDFQIFEDRDECIDFLTDIKPQNIMYSPFFKELRLFLKFSC